MMNISELNNDIDSYMSNIYGKSYCVEDNRYNQLYNYMYDPASNCHPGNLRNNFLHKSVGNAPLYNKTIAYPDNMKYVVNQHGCKPKHRSVTELKISKKCGENKCDHVAYGKLDGIDEWVYLGKLTKNEISILFNNKKLPITFDN